MVSSSIPQRPAGEAEPMIRKKPSKAVAPPPPRVRQQVTEVPGTAVSKELTPPTTSALALDLLPQQKGDESAAPPSDTNPTEGLWMDKGGF